MLNICRLCLRAREVPLNNIIASTVKCSDLTLIDCLYWVFGVEVNVCDPFSKLICLQCINVVKFVGTFREVFQKNQIILEEEKDLLEYYRTRKINTLLFFKEVDTFLKNIFSIDSSDSTRDSCTSVKKINRNSVTQARNQSDLFSQPIIILPRLEESNIYKEYKKIHGTLYKKRVRVSKNDGELTVVEDVNINCKLLPNDRFSRLPIVSLTRFEESNIYNEYEKIDDVTYKKIVNLIGDTTKKTRDIDTITDLGSDVTNKEILTNPASDNYVKVSIDIFKYFPFPSLTIPRLENSEIQKEYKVVNDTTYKEISGEFNRSSDLMRYKSIKRPNFIEYYYSLPTFAIQELIKEKHEIISGCKEIIKHPNKVYDSREPLFDVEDVYHVEVCKYCSKVFKNKQMLNYHYEVKHRPFSKYKSNTIEDRKCQTKKRAKRRTTKQLTTRQTSKLKSERLLRDKSLIPNNVPSHIVLNSIRRNWSKISNAIGQIEHKNFTNNYEHFPNLKFVKESNENKFIFRKHKVRETNEKSKPKSKNLNIDIKNEILGNSGDQNNVQNTVQEEIQLLEARDNQQQLKNLPQSASPEIILDIEGVKEKAINEKIVILSNYNLQNRLSILSKNIDEKKIEKCCETTNLTNDFGNINQETNIKSNVIKSRSSNDDKLNLNNIAGNTLLQMNEEQRFDAFLQLTEDLPYVNNINVGKNSLTLKRKHQREVEHPKKRKRCKKVVTKEGHRIQNMSKQNLNSNITKLSGMMSLIEIRDREQTTGSVPANDACCFSNKKFHTIPSSLSMPLLEPQCGPRPATPSNLTMPSLEKEIDEKTNTIPLQTQMQNTTVVKIIQNSKFVPEICYYKKVGNESNSCNPQLNKISVNFENNHREINIFNNTQVTLPNESDEQTKIIQNVVLSDFCVIDKEISESYNINKHHDNVSVSKSKSDEANDQRPKVETLMQNRSDILKRRDELVQSKNDAQDTFSSEHHNDNNSNVKLSNDCGIDKEISKSYHIIECRGDIGIPKSDEADDERQGSYPGTLRKLWRNVRKKREELEQHKSGTQNTLLSGSHNVVANENNSNILLSNHCVINQELSKSDNFNKCYVYVEDDSENDVIDKEISESYNINVHHDNVGVSKSKSDEAVSKNQILNLETLQNKRFWKKIEELEQIKQDRETLQTEVVKNVIIDHNYDGSSRFLHLD